MLRIILYFSPAFARAREALCHNPGVPFAELDLGAIARAVAQVADGPDDGADVYFERREEIERAVGAEGPAERVWREEGLAVRLRRDGRTWLASRDALDGAALADALRQVARAQPRTSLPEPSGAAGPWPGPPSAPELAELGDGIERALRARRVAFPLALTLRRHCRWLQVVGTRPTPAAQSERYYSLRAELPWGRHGTLLTELGEASIAATAEALIGQFRARQAPPPATTGVPLLLAPPAVAVLLHEAVAHLLEADVQARLADPGAVGRDRELGASLLSVLDDPATAPATVARTADDEGEPVVRRWLLRGGRVGELLADLAAVASRPAELLPGAGWRSSRHLLPSPRSRHLELLAGETSAAELLAATEDGLWLPEVERGALDPATGTIVLDIPWARRIGQAELGEAVGRFRLAASVDELLHAVVAVGEERVAAGAGWCAKDGQRLPVFSTVPSLALAALEDRR